MLNRLLRVFLTFVASAFAEDSSYFKFSIDEDHLSGAPDFSFLNHAITPADRIVVRDGHFCRIGDGQRVRMFGVNLAFGANFPDPADAPRIAKRLRRLGVNLVRLHHLDTKPDRRAEDANSAITLGPYPTLNPVSIARLRTFLNALKAEGIYVNLNLHIGYEFRPDVDKVPALPAGVAFPKHSKPLHIFFPRMIDLQAEYARKLIAALNLKEDPVLAMVEINNESSMIKAWQSRAIDNAVAGEYRAELERQWSAFLRNKDHTSEAAPLVKSDKPEPGRRTNDYLLFLTGLDRYYNSRILAAVREAAGKLVPVTGTQMNFAGFLTLDSQADLDYQDGHFYVDFYLFPNGPWSAWDQRDWKIQNLSSSGSGLDAILNIAAYREAGRPYTISEFNQRWPNTYGAEIDPTLAAFAAFQDWDAIIHFAYAHNQGWETNLPNGLNLEGDWTKYPNIGQSAWLLRSGAIQPAKQAITIPISQQLRLQAGQEKAVGKVLPFLKTTTGYDPAVALLHRVAIKADSEHRIPDEAKAAGASPYRSDTGEMEYDPKARLLLIHAPQAAGVMGFAGGKTVTSGAIDLSLTGNDSGFATVLVTALDGKSIAESSRLLVSTPGYTLRTQPGSNPPSPQKLIPYGKGYWTLEPEPGVTDKPSGHLDKGIGPVWMKRVESFLTVRTSAKKLAVYPLDGRGARQAALKDVEKTKGGFRIHIQAAGQAFSPWYELVAER